MGVVYTPKEAALELRCSQSAVYNMVASGRLKCYLIGKKGVRITQEAIDEFKNGNAS